LFGQEIRIMATARPFWRGYLKLSLVTCPVAMLPAVSESEKVSFHTLNRATGHRVHARYVDAETGKPVNDVDEVKGYERDNGEYVMLEDEELAAVALESARTIEIDSFVPADSIGWIWYDTPHYLIPDEKIGEEAFGVIREAMASSNMRAISRVVLYNRERAVLLEPRDKGIVLWTLRYGDEVRDPKPYFAGIKNDKVATKDKAALGKLIEKGLRDWDPGLAKDPVQHTLLEMIAAKRKTMKRGRGKQGPSKHNVVDLTALLKRSLQGGAAARR
jgi:DNA end-binding protein Ku